VLERTELLDWLDALELVDACECGEAPDVDLDEEEEEDEDEEEEEEEEEEEKKEGVSGIIDQ
jgi:ribosomal protein L12E/L44/L45/RPP1/RPP2